MINVQAMTPVEDIYDAGGKTVIDLKELPYYDGEPYDLMDDKSFKHFMVELERDVRSSFEYRQLMNYLRDTEGMDRCSVLNVTAESGSKIRIEIHHAPLTLYDICLAVYKKRADKKESITPASIAEEVMYLHYIGWVGLVPLCSTVHEAVHNGYMFIPTDIVRGNYQAFVQSYYNYIDPETLDAIDNAEQATKDNLVEQTKQIFNDHKLYVNVNGSYAIPRKDEAKNAIKNRITDIKNDKINHTGKVLCTVVNKTSD